MFGHAIHLPIRSTSTRRKLVAAMAVLTSLVVINAAVAVAGVSRLLNLRSDVRPRHPSPDSKHQHAAEAGRGHGGPDEPRRDQRGGCRRWGLATPKPQI